MLFEFGDEEKLRFKVKGLGRICKRKVWGLGFREDLQKQGLGFREVLGVLYLGLGHSPLQQLSRKVK